MLASVARSSQDYIRKQANQPDSAKVHLLFDLADHFPTAFKMLDLISPKCSYKVKSI